MPGGRDPPTHGGEVPRIGCRWVRRKPQYGAALDRHGRSSPKLGAVHRARWEVKRTGGQRCTSSSVHPCGMGYARDTPPPSSPAAQATMRANRSRDTGPELALRRALHGRGLRFRVDHAPVPGLRCRADVVFTRARVAVFVDGCFWHHCPEHGTIPRANGDWWQAKLRANVARDRRNDIALEAAGWHVIRTWEHEPLEAAAAKVINAVAGRRGDRGGRRVGLDGAVPTPEWVSGEKP